MKHFCISLQDLKDRRRYCQEHFASRGVDVSFFDAYNGKKLGLKTTIPYMDDQPDWKPGDGPVYRIGFGQIGCLLSHLNVWKAMRHILGDEFVVLEDDVELVENYNERLAVLLNNLPSDWQFVFLGCCCLPEEQIKVAPQIVKTPHPPMCTHAYMIKRSAIDVLIETNSVAWSAVDIQIQKLSLARLNYYTVTPPLADQLSITGRGNSPEFHSQTVHL